MTLLFDRFVCFLSIFAVLRALAEGRIRWAFWPPGTDVQTIIAHQGGGEAPDGAGNGIWIAHGQDESDAESEDDRHARPHGSDSEDDDDDHDGQAAVSDSEEEDEEEGDEEDDWASSRRRSAAAPRPLKRTLSLSAPPLLRHTPFINLAPAPREPDISKGHGPVTASTLGPELSRPGNHDVIKRTARNRPGRGSPGLSTCMSSGRPRLGLQPRRWGKPRVLGSAFRASFTPHPVPF